MFAPPILYIFSGLPGSGKSTLAQQLARRVNAVYLRIDTIEQALRDLCAIDVEGEGYRLAYRVAADNLKLDSNVVADSSWSIPRPGTRAPISPTFYSSCRASAPSQHDERARHRPLRSPLSGYLRRRACSSRGRVTRSCAAIHRRHDVGLRERKGRIHRTCDRAALSAGYPRDLR